ncbi:MAG TPA: hypothetical protein VEU47_13495 [Candidatus Cybelea sp.]|nr:hypothetical protein [Candidatus Cybelea sp.]
MPSESRAQHNLVEFVDHDPTGARRAGIRMPQSVAHEFVAADKGRDLKKLPKKVAAKKAAPVFGALAYPK